MRTSLNPDSPVTITLDRKYPLSPSSAERFAERWDDVAWGAVSATVGCSPGYVPFAYIHCRRAIARIKYRLLYGELL